MLTTSSACWWEKVISVHQCGRVFVWWRMGKELPAGVEHAAIAAAVYQGRRSRRRWSPSDGRSGSLQKKICIHGLQRDLLKTVCFWYKKKQIQKCTWLPDKLQLRMIMPYRPCENTDKDGSFTRSRYTLNRLTAADFKWDVPFWRRRFFLPLWAAAKVLHEAIELGQRRRTSFLQLSTRHWKRESLLFITKWLR